MPNIKPRREFQDVNLPSLMGGPDPATAPKDKSRKEKRRKKTEGKTPPNGSRRREKDERARSCDDGEVVPVEDTFLNDWGFGRHSTSREPCHLPDAKKSARLEITPTPFLSETPIKPVLFLDPTN